MSRFAIILVIFSLAIPIINSQVPGTPDSGNKCGSCPCDQPCPSSPPPPAPELPPPPPPPSPPPPPPPKKPKSPICPPPPGTPSLPNVPFPPSPYVYITGPPGNLYPVDNYYSGAARSFTVGLPISLILIVSMIQLALW